MRSDAVKIGITRLSSLPRGASDAVMTTEMTRALATPEKKHSIGKHEAKKARLPKRVKPLLSLSILLPKTAESESATDKTRTEAIAVLS